MDAKCLLGTTAILFGYAAGVLFTCRNFVGIHVARPSKMLSAELVIVVIVGMLLVLVTGNIVFSFVAERRNPPIGNFIDCEGVRLHYLERGDKAAPTVVLFHGNGSLIQDLIISGLVDRLASRNRVLCFDRPGFGYSQRPCASGLRHPKRRCS
jgi:hypothetical protein